MTMQWEDERYVRVYTRDTIEWDMLCWQARALWPLVLRKVDRAGLLELGKFGARGLARSLKVPQDLVEPGLNGTEEGPGLIEDGCLEIRGTLLVVPNFIEAQETRSGDAQRKRDQRERAAAVARYEAVTGRTAPLDERENCNGANNSVTSGHQESPAVTNGHSVLCRSVPCCAVPSMPEEPEARAREAGPGQGAESEPTPGEQQTTFALEPDPPPAPELELGKPANAEQRRVVDRWRAQALEVLGALNRARRRAIPNSRDIRPTYTSLAEIAKRLEAGRTAEECEAVIVACEGAIAAGDDRGREYFDSISPFRAENFERKLAQPPPLRGARAGPLRLLPPSTSVNEESRELRREVWR